MFINRDENGKIVALFANEQFEGQEWLDDDNEEVINFGKPSEKEVNNAKIQTQITEIDLKRIRALAEGGTNPETGKAYLEEYTEQIISLRGQLP